MAFRNWSWNRSYRNLERWLGVGCYFAPNTAIGLITLALTAPLFSDRDALHLAAGGLLAASLVVLPSRAEWLVAIAAGIWLAVSHVGGLPDWCGLAAGVLSTDSAIALQIAVVGVVSIAVMAADLDVVLAISFTVASLTVVLLLWAMLVKPSTRRRSAVETDPEVALVPNLVM